MASSTRGKWSAVGTIVSAPIRGFYYPGRVKAIKRSVDQTASSPPLYSVIFSDPLGSLTDQEPSDDQGLILDFTGEQLIGRGFGPITSALLCENQKVYITHRGREVSARVLKHEQDDMLQLILDADSQEMSTKLSEVRLLPSRKSGRVQEHPDYSLLASGRRSPTESENEMSSGTISGSANSTSTLTGKMTKQAGSGRRRTTSSSSTSLLSSESSIILSSAKDHPVHTVSAHIDVPSQSSGRKRRTSNPELMDECTAALVLMSLSASPRSPTFMTERLSRIFKCTWPHCGQEAWNCSDIEKHIRDEHFQNGEEMPGEEDFDFYYTEIDLRRQDSNGQPKNGFAGLTHPGPDSPVSLSEDGASSSSSTSAVMTGDNSMDSNPPSPEQSGNSFNFSKSNSAFTPVQYRHLEDHEYNRRPDPAGVSILGSRRGRKSGNSSVLSPTSTASHPINIPHHLDSASGAGGHPPMSSSFGGFSGASSLSSGFGSYNNSFGSGYMPLSPPRNSGSLSSFSTGSNKYLRVGQARVDGSGTTILQNSVNRSSPTKRVRGETRKCRKVYGMSQRMNWCTSCRWKKACTRFSDS